jgi:carboxyl-terminal processing protease
MHFDERKRLFSGREGRRAKIVQDVCCRKSNLLKYVIVIILVVCQSSLLVEAETLPRISGHPKQDFIARGEALNTSRLGQSQDTLLAGAGSGFQLFQAAINLITEYYVEKVSAHDLVKMVAEKLPFVVLPHCVEGVGKCSGDVDRCFVSDINTMATRCNLDVNRLLCSALNISLQELDPNSCVMDAGLLKELEIGTSGKFGGVGMVVSAKGADYVVVSPFEGSPAYKAGIKAGDTILEIDGQPLHGLPLLEVLRKVRGPAGSVMSVRVRDSRSDQIRQIKMHRRLIRIHPVRYLLLERNIGYLRIVNFQKGTAGEVYKALGQVSRSGAGKLAGLILDLRDDPGGLFDEAIQVANLFKESGIITSVRGRRRGLNRDFTANGSSRLPRIPLAILINKGTASASEILVGALQGMPETLVLGERSFGKASVQAVFRLNKGMAIRLTTAHYYTADGRDIDGKGLEPDVGIPGSDEDPSKGTVDLLSSEQLRGDTDIRAALAYLHSGAMPARSPFSSWY